MAKMFVVGLTFAAVFAIAEIKVHREPGEEARPISVLRAVASAQHAYAALNGGYATSLKTLAAPCSAGQHGFISPDLSSDPTVIRGYEIRLQADASDLTGRVDCHGNPTARSYYVTAVPLERAETAMRAFAVDQNNVIWYGHAATGTTPKPPFSETAGLKRLQ